MRKSYVVSSRWFTTRRNLAQMIAPSQFFRYVPSGLALGIVGALGEGTAEGGDRVAAQASTPPPIPCEQAPITATSLIRTTSRL
jgi:hypothetical protein